MILPLFLEQLLVMLVGMADTFVVSYAGEAVVSGVAFAAAVWQGGAGCHGSLCDLP